MQFSDWASSAQGSAIREILKVTEQPAVISFAGGLPAGEFFPTEAMRRAFDQVLREQPVASLQYGITEGFAPLRETIRHRLQRGGIRTTVEQISIVNGSQHGLELLARVLANPGDAIAVEEPSYLGALQAFGSLTPRFLPVPMDREGIVPDALEAVLRQERPRFLYVIPNFQNPTGSTMSLARRRQVLAVCARFDLPVVEDDPYGELRYDGEALPSLRSLDGDGRVVYLGSFSKVLAPGLRIGYVEGPLEVVRRVNIAKQASCLHVSSLSQQGVHRLLQDWDLDAHIARLIGAYRERRDAMRGAMDRHFPDGVRRGRPQGGMFLWVELPEGMDAGTLLERALARRVAFVPGIHFHAGGKGANTLRLNFSHATPEIIAEGVKRLAESLEGMPAVAF